MPEVEFTFGQIQSNAVIATVRFLAPQPDFEADVYVTISERIDDGLGVASPFIGEDLHVSLHRLRDSVAVALDTMEAATGAPMGGLP